MGNSASAPKDSSNTVFISYRREPAWSIARSIFLALRDKNYDVFMDVEDIDNGQFDTVILNQSAARAHFLLILTPGTLDRCVSADDWVRREIEHAIDLQRNVVPVLVDNFNFVGTEQMLTGKLGGLPRYNALPLVPYYFDAGIDILHDRFLKQEVKGDIATVSDEEHAVVQQKIEKAANITVPPSPEPPPLPPVTLPSVTLPSVTLTPPPLPPNPFPPRPPNTPDFAQQAKELSAEGDFRGALNAYTSAIQLDPNNAEAYFGRGSVRNNLGDLGSALSDFDQAIQLDPNQSAYYRNRGFARLLAGDRQDGLADCDQAIKLDPNDAEAYYTRGVAHEELHNPTDALADYENAVRLDPKNILASHRRDILKARAAQPTQPGK